MRDEILAAGSTTGSHCDDSVQSAPPLAASTVVSGSTAVRRQYRNVVYVATI